MLLLNKSFKNHLDITIILELEITFSKETPIVFQINYTKEFRIRNNFLLFL